MNPVKVKALSAFSLGAGKDVFPGDVFELEATQAKIKVASGDVEYVLSDVPDAVADPTPEPETRGRRR